MKNEKLKYYDGNQDGQKMLTVLLNRPIYAENGQSPTLEEAIRTDALNLAQETVGAINRNLYVKPDNIIGKIIPRSITWGYQDVANIYQGSDSLESLLTKSSNETMVTGEITDPTQDTVARQWWANTIGYETRAALKRQKTAADKKMSYQQAVGSQMASQEIDNKIIDLLVNREYSKQIQKLSRLVQVGFQKLGSQEKAVNFAALIYEIDRRKTDDTWKQNILQETILRGLAGTPINLISIICTINEFDYQGGCNLNPNLDTYKNNSKVEPVPLIIDEMASIISLFEYYQVNSNFTIYVADTDYTEVGSYGPLTSKNSQNIKDYLANLSQYVKKYDGSISIAPISSITNDNVLYQTVKTKVQEWVTIRQNSDFNRRLGKKFEEVAEKISEALIKKKFFSSDLIKDESVKMAQRNWAVNAAQGAVLSRLSENSLFVSTERTERDVNYLIDLGTTATFPPLLYILNAAEKWNRKYIDKTIYEAN